MRLSKIKTKEIRYVVWKYRLKRFLPHILTLCLAVIVAGGAFSAYSVYHKKHQKARVNLKHLAGTIPSTAARWSARLPDHLPESSSFLIKRAAKSPEEKGKIEVPPKSP